MVTKKPDMALSIVNYVESQFVCTDAGKLTGTAEKDGLVKAVSLVTKEHWREQKEFKKEESLDAATDAFSRKLLKYKARIYLMLRKAQLCRRECRLSLSVDSQPVRIVYFYFDLFLFDFRSCLILCDFNYLQDISTIVLKANLECARGNYKKAINLLNSITTETLDLK